MPTAGAGPLLLPEDTDAALGFQFSTPFPAQPANTNINYAVTGNYYEALIAVTYVLVSDATVGNRQSALVVLDQSAGVVLLVNAAATQGPSTTVRYTFAVDVATISVAGGTNMTVQTPAFVLFPGWKIQFGVTAFVGAGDAVTSANVLMQRFPSGSRARPVAPVAPLLLT